MRKRYVAGPNDENRRLDRILRIMYPQVPLGALARFIRTGAVLVNRERANHNSRIHEGDVIEAPERLVPDEAGRERREPSRVEELPPVIFRNGHVLVVNKPAGLPVHGPRSLARRVQDWAVKESWIDESLSFRTGPVHRIDATTSGIQLFSMSLNGARVLTEAFREHTARKLYLTIVDGIMEERTLESSPVLYDRSRRIAVSGRGKKARTVFVPLAHRYEPSYTLLAAAPTTGRTHQIRVHAQAIGHPLVADAKYGGTRWTMDLSPAGHILHNLFVCIDSDEAERELHTNPVWTARLEPGTWNVIRELFGDSAPIEERLSTLASEACTRASGNRTIRL